MILGFDPGREKCGIAVMGQDSQLYYHEVILASDVLTTIQSLCQQFTIDTVVMGDQTTSKLWKQKLTEILPKSLSIIQVNERYSTLEARDRYWQLYPPKGLTRLIPKGMRTPPRPIDDIVAIVLIERYLNQ
ncbi:Resolvase, RNase H domain protein fold-contiaining protein [Planktothrix tepida]|uniref:Resolvase, RNase H domain protein fold-contiaining protein n=2 Tax=Planktothrix TaxID=54304 RepID=A0A1J1LES0_9CYAN|nr:MULTISPECIES: pre-16S rRNA-processing nuclease YqgF [Planktothrix]CAD5916604.1 Resolvase, RNase H domain protein fold-contiaining protein [Planktothrix tepida]CAD5985507.1 Resolvase, RNase H domain protein fold-contiaining protein [Planktothrix pseudagardhii]CUR30678.1 Resolvase, RNase H domain protein fold-contiaining protein [Planktothrix tepida PCC 9214]